MLLYIKEYEMLITSLCGLPYFDALFKQILVVISSLTFALQYILKAIYSKPVPVDFITLEQLEKFALIKKSHWIELKKWLLPLLNCHHSTFYLVHWFWGNLPIDFSAIFPTCIAVEQVQCHTLEQNLSWRCNYCLILWSKKRF